jgi:hypothetical protein
MSVKVSGARYRVAAVVRYRGLLAAFPLIRRAPNHEVVSLVRGRVVCVHHRRLPVS